MKTTFTIILVLVISLTSSADQPVFVQLTDGSKINAQTRSSTFPASSENLSDDLAVRYDSITKIAATQKGNFQVDFKNGDRLTVRASDGEVGFQTVFGNIAIEPKLIQSLEVRPAPNRRSSVAQLAQPVMTQERMPADGPRVHFDGHDWDVWRTQWQVIDNKLTAIGKIRPGFDYGHWGRGRGGLAITGNGDKEWQDYEVEFNFEMIPASRDFFHAHIPGETRGMAVYVRAQSMTESWNEPDTAYVVGINPFGGWSIAAHHNHHFIGKGWSPNFGGTVEKFVDGRVEEGLRADNNKLRIRVEGTVISVWLNDEFLTEFNHEEGGQIPPIPYGGFGVTWQFESLGWISNFKVKHL